MDLVVFRCKFGYGCSVSVDGGKPVYYTKLLDYGSEFEVVVQTFSRFVVQDHCEIALHAGGEVVSSHVNKWGETILDSVRVSSDKLIDYCRRLQQTENPYRGMMQTSTGEWVWADDWDDVEDLRVPVELVAFREPQ